MNKLNRKILTAIVIASMVVPMTTVMAAQKESAKPSVQNAGAVKKQEVKEKVSDLKEKHEAFKLEMKANKETIKQNNEDLQAVRKEIVSKKQEINKILEGLIENKKVIPSDLLAAIKAQQAVIKADLQAVNSGKGSLDKASKEAVEQVKGNNAEGVVKGLDNVIAKQEARLAALKKLNGDLDVLVKLVKQTQSLATEPVAEAK